MSVDVLARLVVGVDSVCFLYGPRKVFLYKQVNGLAAILYTSGGVDAWSDAEDDVRHAYFFIG